MRRFAIVLAVAALAGLGFGLSGVLQAATPQTLNGSVGPGFTISLKKPAGAQVTTLLPGTYRIVVRDLGSNHDFHLVGPGVNRKTGIATKSTATWTLTLKAGQYRLFCDVHSSMRRAFRVALRPSTTIPPPATTSDVPPSTDYGPSY